MYCKLPITNQASIFGSIFFLLTLISLFIIGSFPGIWGKVHFYGSAYFLLTFTFMLVFFAYSDFKSKNTHNIALVETFSLILLWVIFGITLIRSETNSNVGFAIAEIVMIILYTLNVNLMCLKAWTYDVVV